MPSANPIVTILGDSRVFDTYYINEAYSEGYGYDATFPHLLRKQALQAGPGGFDIVHIPDHFRGGTIDNNNIRLALTDPAVVVLCDGIWETLVHKESFIAWATDRIRKHATHSADALELSYSSRRLADLFIANELPLSPRRYAERQRRIISYFRRRRRQCIWMSLPMPPRSHLDRLHYVGNYRCIPEWDECLKAVNDAMAPVVSRHGAVWLDLDALVGAQGGFGKALIDQWHFSRSFHAAIAAELARILPALLADNPLGADHVSRRFLLAHAPAEEPLALYGPAAAVEQWRSENPRARVEAVIAEGAGGEIVGDAPAVSLAAVSGLAARCIVAVAPEAMTPAAECDLLTRLPRDCILLYPGELGVIVNPTSAERAKFEQLR